MTITLQIGILADRYRVFLTSRIAGRGDYYNAVYLSVRRRTFSFSSSVICLNSVPHSTFVLILHQCGVIFCLINSSFFNFCDIYTIFVSVWYNEFKLPSELSRFVLAMLIPQVNEGIYKMCMSNSLNYNKM